MTTLTDLRVSQFQPFPFDAFIFSITCSECGCNHSEKVAEPNVRTDACDNSECPCHVGFHFTCRCGATQFATEAEACAFNRTRIPSAIGSSPNRCPSCRTGVADHAFNGDESTDFRCFDCDRRFHSHGGPA